MPRPLRATRYLTQQNANLAAFIMKKLPYLDYEEAMTFYRSVDPVLDAQSKALLACNDRFYLMVALLNRTDMVRRADIMNKAWLYDRCREVEANPDGYLDLWSRYHFKAVDVNELVATPTGWRKHGDLRAGDEVFGPDGMPTPVIATTPVFTEAGCYRISFCDGYSVTVSGDHLWTVSLPSKARIGGGNKREKWKVETLNTRDLKWHVDEANAVPSRRSPTIPIAAPIFRRREVLPLDPYVLGAWLGDGTTGHCTITSGLEDADEMEAILAATGLRVRQRKHSNAVTLCIGTGVSNDRSSSDVANALRSLGIYKNKHIPRSYMMASEDQRWSLLQGLMDTDGSCAKSCGQAIFCAANERLAGNLFDLAQSLGLKPTMFERSGMYKGAPRAFWQVQFHGRASRPPFRLSRKVAMCRDPGAHRETSGRRRIVSVKPVASIPVSCIQVARGDGLYLVGKNYVTTHNSSIITNAGIIQEVLTDPEITIALFSHNKKGANKFLGQIKTEFEKNKRLLECFPDVLWKTPSRESSRWSSDGIIVKRKGNPKEATVEAHGLLDGMPTGGHWQILVYDDIVTEKTAKNPDMVRKATEQWELSTNLGVGELTRSWMIGTRYSYGDPYSIVLQRGIKPRLYPATHNGKLEGKPVLYSEAWWEGVKQKQRSTAAAQMLQNPMAGKENTFLPAWFRPWLVRPSVMNVYIMCDPQKGSSASSDRTAIAVVGIDGQGMKYLLDGYRHRMALSERWVAVRDLYAKWSRMPGVGICEVGYERYGERTDEDYFRQQMSEGQHTFTLKILNWVQGGGQSKKDRVERLEPDFKNGRFLLPGVVWSDGTMGNCYWKFEDNENAPVHSQIIQWPQKGLTNNMQRVVSSGAGHLCARPILRRDEDNRVYDLTVALRDEMMLFPFAPKDDLVDAVSRIYDMDPVTPSIYEDREAERLTMAFEER